MSKKSKVPQRPKSAREIARAKVPQRPKLAQEIAREIVDSAFSGSSDSELIIGIEDDHRCDDLLGAVQREQPGPNLLSSDEFDRLHRQIDRALPDDAARTLLGRLIDAKDTEAIDWGRAYLMLGIEVGRRLGGVR